MAQQKKNRCDVVSFVIVGYFKHILQPRNCKGSVLPLVNEKKDEANMLQEQSHETHSKMQDGGKLVTFTVIPEACLGFLIIWNNGLFFLRNKNNLDLYSEIMRFLK